MIERAKAFATLAHEGQFRKGTTRPYIVHPLEVGEIVATMTDDEEIISAAILHDTIEDCKSVTETMIRAQFGERVAHLVMQESEDKSKTWMERKSATIEFLKKAPKEVQVIGLADKEAVSITIPDTVTIDGVTYKVTEIGDGAFKDNKRKN